MKIKVEVDLNDFIGGWGDDLDTMIKEDVTREVLTKLKKTPEYKAHIALKLEKMIGAL